PEQAEKNVVPEKQNFEDRTSECNSAPRKASPKEKRSAVFNKVIKAVTSLWVVAAAVVVGVVEIEEFLPYRQLVKAEIIYTDETFAVYEIFLDGYSPADKLTAVVYNDFTYREIDLYERYEYNERDNGDYNSEEGSQDYGLQGEIGDLTPHMSYTFEVKDGDKSVGKCYFKTERKEEYYDPQDPQEPYEEVDYPVISIDEVWDVSAMYSVNMNGYEPKNSLSGVAYSAAGSVEVDLERQLSEYADMTEEEKSGYSFEGIISDLLSSTTYTFEIWDGNDMIASAVFMTADPDEPYEYLPTAEIDGIWDSWATFVVNMNGYEPKNELTCIAYDATGDYREIDISEQMSEYSDMPEEEKAEYAFDGEITDLSPSTTYTFEVKDGNEIIASAEFTTTEFDESQGG
ncbi:MAG: hypothetical protein J5903_00390, partial [Clostridia bacterium]|nr:hypothetical protein [Clostridia bacterium]